MNCAVCDDCEPHPEVPGRCLYIGPYSGFTESEPINEEFYIASRYGTGDNARLAGALS